MKKEKIITIKKYLEGEKRKTLNDRLTNFYLSNIPINLFFKVFEGVSQTPKDVADFILDDKNSFDLGVFGSRASGASTYKAYNGKGNYQGSTCTLGSTHSRFHG